MRCASVGAGVRNARAISSVVSPQTSRSVSATCASAASAGWQQVKIRRSRSSSTLSGSAHAAGVVDARRRALVADRRARRSAARRRMASIALNRPADTSHARGLAGTPSRGHCSSAARNASCSASSAEVEVAEQANQRREHPAGLGDVDGVHRLVNGIGRSHERAITSSFPPPAQAAACCRSRAPPFDNVTGGHEDETQYGAVDGAGAARDVSFSLPA